MLDKFIYYYQLDAMDCGPTCLPMIAKYYGRHYNLETFRQHSFISHEGVSMLGGSDAAEYIGFRTSRDITHEQVMQVQNILNSRSRKRLGYMTPKEKLKELTNMDYKAVALSA